MTDQSGRSSAFLDDIAKLATSAAGLAKSAKDEVDTLMRGRIDRWLADRDFVTREEFDAVAEMARLAREENDRLSARLAALEARFSAEK